MPMARALELIQAAGGLSVLAHPGERWDEAALSRLASFGLRGVEVKFPAANLSRIAELARIAGRLGLVRTGGSDSHTPADRAIGSVGLTGGEWRSLAGKASGS